MKSSTDDAMRILRDTVYSRFTSDVIAHDWPHLERVAGMANWIAQREGGNIVVITAAAYLHDIHRLQERVSGKVVMPAEAMTEVQEILLTTGLPNSLHGPICESIEFTERYRCAGDRWEDHKPSLESKIVRDADMLDALGPIGIARAFMFGGALGEALYTPLANENNGDRLYKPGVTSSVVAHFHEKLFKLEEEMLTASGQSLARDKTIYMRSYINTLLADLKLGNWSI